jgi:hypothetical protein
MILGILFGLILLVLFYFFARMVKRTGQGFVQSQNASRQWPSAEGMIVRSSVKKVEGVHYNRLLRRNEPETAYYPDVEYKFTVKGTGYVGNRLSTVLSGSERPDAAVVKIILDTYPVGKHVRVFYDPQNPSNCLLNPSEDYGPFGDLSRFNYLSNILPKDMLLDPVFTFVMRLVFCLTLIISIILVASIVHSVAVPNHKNIFGSIPVLIALLVIMLAPIGYRFFMRNEGKALLEKARAAQTWPSVRGQITASDLARELLEYTFVVNDSKHVGYSILIGGRKSGKMVQDRWKKLRKGDVVQVYYNPSNIKDCALDPLDLKDAESLSRFDLLGVLF